MNSKPRLIVAQVFVVILFGLIVYRSASVQLFPTQRLKQSQLSQYKTEIHKVASRGNIFDRSRRPLALTVNSYSVFAHPHQVKQASKSAKVLSNILKLPLGEIEKDLRSDKPFVWIKRKIDNSVKEQLEKYQLGGIHFLSESKRIYPNDMLASHLLGFVNVDMKGIAGLELKFDKALEGTPRKINVLRDAVGRVIYVGESASSRSRAGYDLILTIDSTIQFSLEKELRNIVQEFEALGAMAIAMDPRNGEILAIASYPTYNPNAPSHVKPDILRHRLVSDVFEPGSILKPFTIAAALSYGTATANKVYDCEGGRIRIKNRVITEASMSHVHDTLPLSEILKYSSNVCAVKVALELGSQRLHTFLSLMGLARVTEIDMPGELPGIMHPWKSWSDINLATISYGHGIAITPIQIMRAYGVFANEGYLVKPHVVSRVEDEFQNLIYANDELPRVQVLDPDIATQVKKMLIEVTQKGGTGVLAKPFGLAIPGKTGTAIKYDETIGGYKEGAYISSFVGMFPPESPKVVLMVLVDEPQKRKYGGSVAAPAFRNISEKMISLLSLHPATPGVLADGSLLSRRDPSPSAQDDGRVQAKDDGRVQQDNSLLFRHPERSEGSRREKKGSFLPSALKMLGAERMPDLRGLTLSQVRERMLAQNIPFEFQGVGRVVSQSPSPGSALSSGKPVKIVLK